MRGPNRLVNIKYKDGNVKRLPWKLAIVQVELGRADFISNTLYKAAIAGIKVKPNQTQNEIMELVRASRHKATKPKVDENVERHTNTNNKKTVKNSKHKNSNKKVKIKSK